MKHITGYRRPSPPPPSHVPGFPSHATSWCRRDASKHITLHCSVVFFQTCARARISLSFCKRGRKGEAGAGRTRCFVDVLFLKPTCHADRPKQLGPPWTFRRCFLGWSWARSCAPLPRRGAASGERETNKVHSQVSKNTHLGAKNCMCVTPLNRGDAFSVPCAPNLEKAARTLNENTNPSCWLALRALPARGLTPCVRCLRQRRDYIKKINWVSATPKRNYFIGSQRVAQTVYIQDTNLPQSRVSSNPSFLPPPDITRQSCSCHDRSVHS